MTGSAKQSKLPDGVIMDCFLALLLAIDDVSVPLMEPKAGLRFSSSGGTGSMSIRPPAWGECHDARNDTRHHPDHLPAGRLQRPVWRLRLRLRPLGNGPRRRRSGRAAPSVTAWQALSPARH